MIKIRLEGLPEEIEKAAEKLSNSFRILQQSEPYLNKGKSVFARIYIDAELKKED